MMNGFVKNETGSKYNLANSRRYPEYAANMLVGRNRPKFQESLHWHNGKHLHCSMASQGMESFLSFFQFYELSMLLNCQIYFRTVAASKVNRVS